MFDNGSGCMKIGFAGEELPSYVFPTVVGQTEPQVPCTSHFLFSCEESLHGVRQLLWKTLCTEIDLTCSLLLAVCYVPACASSNALVCW